MPRLPQPDEQWLDRYEIRRELGRGGFGRVYLAYDLRLDREVAIKVLKQSEELTETDYKRFRREINIAASLSHSGVVTVYDGGDHEGLSYLVMRYVEGRDLRFELKQGPLPSERLLSVVRQIASALDYAHGRGLVHRDVKPANILCEAGSDRVYLADFGISRPVDQSSEEQLTRADLGPATFYYAAPEQLKTGNRVDARTDIYAFGCVLYECLTGQRPFEGDIAAVLSAHLHTPPPRVTDARPDLSQQWDDVVARAMAKTPEQRFERCSDIGDAVAALLEGAVRTAPGLRATAPAVAAHAHGGGGATPTMLAPPSPPTQPAAQAPRQPGPRRSGGPPRRRRTRPARGRWALTALMLALLALAGWLFWPRDADSEISSQQPGDESQLDADQMELAAAASVFDPADCRPSTSGELAGQRVAIACSNPQQRPTRVVYRGFANDADRDAAFAQMAGSLSSAPDCRVGQNAAHGYRGADGDGRVLCRVANNQAGLTWTLPGEPILGSSRLDDTGSLDELYAWWDGIVQRDARDRLPDCSTDEGLEQRGAAAAVQCQMTAGVATVASHAQFASVADMDAWYDEVASNARTERLEEVKDGGDPKECNKLGTGKRRWTGADARWSIDEGQGRLLCFVNESDQNALFWTNEATAIGSVAVSPASVHRLRDHVDEWARSPYRIAR